MTTVAPLPPVQPELPDPACEICPPALVQAWPRTVNLCIYEGDDFFLDLALTYPDPSDPNDPPAQLPFAR